MSQSRLAVSPVEAAEMLGVSRDFFDEHIKPRIRVVRMGKRIIVPIRSLEDWIEANAVSIV
jgi:excisionase family DNA binding protein